jgi:hypothetical protein
VFSLQLTLLTFSPASFSIMAKAVAMLGTALLVASKAPAWAAHLKVASFFSDAIPFSADSFDLVVGCHSLSPSLVDGILIERRYAGHKNRSN